MRRGVIRACQKDVILYERYMDEIPQNEKVFSVSEYIEFLNEYLRPTKGFVQGEVGEKISSYPGFTFFNLIDTEDKTMMQCFVTKNVLFSLGVPLEPGMEIRVEGHAAVFKKNGGLNFQIAHIEPIGEGLLKKQFEIVKKRLADAGYFSQERKRRIRPFSDKIGLITSKFGRGAKKDFLTHLGSFGFKIVFAPVKVEGVGAGKEIIDAIDFLNKEYPMLDVIVLTRGGGSWESLQAFNTEEIVKAIIASKIPVMTGIGHEDDTTLADFAADVRASTPTHAARMLSEVWMFASSNLPKFEHGFDASFRTQMKGMQEACVRFEKTIPMRMRETLKKTYTFFSSSLSLMSARTNNMNERIIHEDRILHERMKDWIKRIRVLLVSHEEKLVLASPELRLKQGYSIATDTQGKIITHVRQVAKGDTIVTRFKDGRIAGEVKEIYDREKI